MQHRACTFAVWVFLGSLVLQLAWILALPPFRGIDEFDHAYRAASVADGQWLPSGETAQHGRGELVRVPSALIDAATPECSAMPYTGHDNCRPVHGFADGSATVASAAARYNPVYYWVVGTAARPFDGANALYAMRAMSALLCAVLLGGAAWVTARWARTAWPLAGFLASLTPVAVYSTAIPAPNGVEMCAGLGVWVSLMGLAQRQEETRLGVLATTLFALPLGGVRGLGPLWLACILAVWLVMVGPARAWRVVGSHRVTAAVCAAVVVVVTAAASAWTLVGGSMELEGFDRRLPHPLVGTLGQMPAWLLQSLAAFPSRDEPAPTVVYASSGLVLALFLLLGWARAGARMRLAIGVTALLSTGVPFVLQLSAYPTAGPIWQGRYGWPLAMGVVVLCATALDTRPRTGRFGVALAACGTALVGVAQATSTTTVLSGELSNSPLSGDPRWITAAPWVVCLLAVAGVLLWVLGAHRTAERPGLHHRRRLREKSCRAVAPAAILDVRNHPFERFEDARG